MNRFWEALSNLQKNSRYEQLDTSTKASAIQPPKDIKGNLLAQDKTSMTCDRKQKECRSVFQDSGSKADELTQAGQITNSEAQRLNHHSQR